MKIRSNRTVSAIALALVWACLAAERPRAADREHQQIMADLRMLQEQAQQLQALMNSLGDALRAVNSRLDDQSGFERKSFADGKVQMDTMAGDLRVVREKVDETNVRLGSVLQELETLRDAIPDQSSVPSPAISPDGALAGTSGATTSPAAPPSVSPGSAPNAQRLYQISYGEYTSGNYSLAISGFQSFLSSFPKNPQAPDAQLLIGESYYLDKKDADAVTAYERVIANYPKSASVPQAYYKRGRALERLGQRDRARESYETVIKDYPDADQASLARQGLEALNRPAK